jgi:hypothetical protein
LHITTGLKEVFFSLWNKDFSGNPEKSEVTSWRKKFGEIGENAWHFSVSDPISLLSPVKFVASYERSGVLATCVRRVEKWQTLSRTKFNRVKEERG